MAMSHKMLIYDRKVHDPSKQKYSAVETKCCSLALADDGKHFSPICVYVNLKRAKNVRKLNFQMFT